MDGVGQKETEKEGSVLIQSLYFLRPSSQITVALDGICQYKTEKQMAIKSIHSLFNCDRIGEATIECAV